MTLRHFENKARQSWWLIHIKPGVKSGLSRAKYCRQHGITTTTFIRWLDYLAGKEAARKHAEYQAELRRQQRCEAQEKRPEEARPLSFWRQHGHAQSRPPGVLGHARRGDELERDERAGVRRLAFVADLSAQTARPAGRRRGGYRLASASSSFSPSGRWQ